MTTLKEEIFKQEKNFDLDETSDEVLYEHTESIIKLFEKVIDEKIQYIGLDGIGETATGSINYWRRKTLEELKEELK